MLLLLLKHNRLMATSGAGSSTAGSHGAIAAAPPNHSRSQEQQQQHRTGPDRILIPISQVGHRKSTLSDSSSIASESSTSSSAASSEFLPTFRSVQRSHFFQFCATVLLLFVVPLAVLVSFKREFRSDAFALGVGAWLASETLRQVVFDLLTPAKHEAEPTTLAAEYENLVLDDDPRDMGRHPSLRDDEPPPRPSAMPTIVYSIAQEALRLGVVAIVVRLLPTEAPVAPSRIALLLASADEPDPYPQPHPHPHPHLPPLDPLFWSALWLALGWAGAEILWGSRRLWHQLELYKDVLPLYEGAGGEREVLLGVPSAREDGRAGGAGYGAMDARDGEEALGPADVGRWRSRYEEHAVQYDDSRGDVIDEEVMSDEEDFQYRVREVQREELEDQLGVPLFEVPVGIIFIWRLDRCALLAHCRENKGGRY